jgi:membrane protein
MADTLIDPMWRRLKKRWSFSTEILTEAAREFGIDRASRMVAAVAYRTIFAVAALFIIAVGISGIVVGDEDLAEAEIISQIELVFGSEVSKFLTEMIGSATATSGIAAFVGVALLLWTSSSLFLELQHALNDIFHVSYERMTGLVSLARKRGIGVLWALGLGLMLIAVWLINLVWGWLEALFPPDFATAHFVISLLTPLISLILLPFIFGLIFQTLTVIRVRWRAVWLGGLFTSVVFILVAYGIGWYFSWGEGTSAYAIAGAFFVILLMAYVLSNVFLFGVEVTKVYHDYLEVGDVMSPSVRDAVASAHRPEVVVAAPPEPAPIAAVFGFFAGLVVGWRRSKK